MEPITKKNYGTPKAADYVHIRPAGNCSERRDGEENACVKSKSRRVSLAMIPSLVSPDIISGVFCRDDRFRIAFWRSACQTRPPKYK